MTTIEDPSVDDEMFDTEPEPVEDLADIDRHLASIRRLTRERDSLLDVYNAEIDRLNILAADIHDRYQRRIAWHQAPIESWHRAHRQKRTLELPSGTIKLTVPTEPKAWVADQEAVTAWARASHPEILKAPNITDVRKVVQLVETETGWHALDPATSEIVDGLSVSVPEPSWSFKVADGEAP